MRNGQQKRHPSSPMYVPLLQLHFRCGSNSIRAKLAPQLGTVTVRCITNVCSRKSSQVSLVSVYCKPGEPI